MRLDVPSFNRHGVVVALDSESCVGLAATSDNRQYGYVFNEMTGVVPGHRGRGIALAIKVTADGATSTPPFLTLNGEREMMQGTSSATLDGSADAVLFVLLGSW